MLIDKVMITIQAGDGGDGAVSFRRNEGNPRGGPDGGNGGNGGDVYLKGVDDLTALQKFQYKKSWKGDSGIAGKRKNLFGKNAEDLIIEVPIGTQVLSDDGTCLVEITSADSRYLIARGGKGGRGNNEFKSATNQAPQYAEKGEPGEVKVVTLELKLIAQIGLIGQPNAGKSTLLSLLTNAKPKIGDYPFTTLEPNVGMMEKIMLADIPGLIEGASSGKGLGINFLKHIEKTMLLVHCIDVSVDNLEDTYQTVRKEFEQYNKELLKKPELVVLTKIDQVTPAELKDKLTLCSRFGKKTLTVSALDATSVEEFKKQLLHEYKELAYS